MYTGGPIQGKNVYFYEGSVSYFDVIRVLLDMSLIVFFVLNVVGVHSPRSSF